MPRQYDPRRTCLKVELWPAREQRVWETALKKGGVFDESTGDGAHWAPLTVEANRKSYGRWLGWLQRKAMLDPAKGPCQELTQDNVRAYVEDLSREVSTGMVAHRLADLYTVAQAMVPDGDWRWIRNGWYRARHASRPVRDKQARVVNSRDLFLHGLELMRRADNTETGSEFKRAIAYRDGFIIALLASRPLRRENLVSIEIGSQLVQRGKSYWLIYDAPETKNRNELDWPFPESLVPYLERYLSVHRPVLVARHAAFGEGRPTAGHHLLVSRFGSPLTAHGMYGQFIATTKKKFGHSVNPHGARDSVATTVAIEDPQHVGSTKSLLGHTTWQTSERYYNMAGSMEATMEHQKALLRRRRQPSSGRRT